MAKTLIGTRTSDTEGWAIAREMADVLVKHDLQERCAVAVELIRENSRVATWGIYLVTAR